MRSAGVVLLACLVASCVRTQIVGPFVRSVHVEGQDLVLQLCTVRQRGEEIELGACSYERRRLPITANVPATLTSAQVGHEITPAMRQGVQACATQHGVKGALTVELTINFAGRLVAVTPSAGGPDFADCAAAAFTGARFPPSLRGGRAHVPFELP